jgi:hypothetical protein
MVLLMSIFGTIYASIWENAYGDKVKVYVYLEHENKNVFKNRILFAMRKLGTWVLINQNVVPISMIATLESVKLV